jgi:hypothetical protein
MIALLGLGLVLLAGCDHQHRVDSGLARRPRSGQPGALVILGTIDDRTIAVRALSFTDGSPLSNVVVEARHGDRLLGETRTDAQGMAQVHGRFVDVVRLSAVLGDEKVLLRVGPLRRDAGGVRSKTLPGRDTHRTNAENSAAPEHVSVKLESSPRQAIIGQRVVFTATVLGTDERRSSDLLLEYHLDDSSGMESSYTPPGNESFYFYGYRYEKLPSLVGSASFDDEKVARIPLVLDGPEWSSTRSPIRLTLNATLWDIPSRTALTTTSLELLVHPAAVYVGVRPARRFLPSKEPIKAEAVVVDAMGNAVPGCPVEITITEQRTYPISKVHAAPRGNTLGVVSEERAVGRCSRVSGAAPVECSFPPERPGEYWVEARAFDEQKRQAVSGSHLYIHGTPAPSWQHPTSPTALQLALDRESYDVGDTAEIMVRAPFEGGHGLYTVERAGVLDAYPVDIEGTIHVVSVPVVEAYVGGVDVGFQIFEPDRTRSGTAEGHVRIPVGARSEGVEDERSSTITYFSSVR